jgi:hypothetical protein
MNTTTARSAGIELIAANFVLLITACFKEAPLLICPTPKDRIVRLIDCPKIQLFQKDWDNDDGLQIENTRQKSPAEVLS